MSRARALGARGGGGRAKALGLLVVPQQGEEGGGQLRQVDREGRLEGVLPGGGEGAAHGSQQGLAELGHAGLRGLFRGVEHLQHRGLHRLPALQVDPQAREDLHPLRGEAGHRVGSGERGEPLDLGPEGGAVEAAAVQVGAGGADDGAAVVALDHEVEGELAAEGGLGRLAQLGVQPAAALGLQEDAGPIAAAQPSDGLAIVAGAKLVPGGLRGGGPAGREIRGLEGGQGAGLDGAEIEGATAVAAAGAGPAGAREAADGLCSGGHGDGLAVGQGSSLGLTPCYRACSRGPLAAP